MKRLTEWDEFGNADIIALSDMMPEIYAELSFSETNALTEALNRLAKYEDTMPLERAQELARAEKNGRLVVLQNGASVCNLQSEYCRSKQIADEQLPSCQKAYDFSVERFSTVWDSTIKPAGRALYGWAANPWVWVIEFERCEKPEGD